ncbi:hypothetical protein BL253_31810 [Pseudofrankia asymbiotica]|uniref:Uncharacterized protein n=1 Tax=Pseudofrankia asymbiotica TaxID=1834516 RepID=A0A1V2I211_9ACTN|nr:hypothetical protein BL253_31810 [Pseudofrankia asymbiotica]
MSPTIGWRSVFVAEVCGLTLWVAHHVRKASLSCRELADQICQVSVVGVAASLDAKRRHGIASDGVPVRVETL